MLMSIVRSIVVRCWQRTIAVTMLIVRTWADNSWWKKLVEQTMIEQWLLNVNNCEQWLLTTVVDRVQHNIVWQCAAQHCNKLLTTLIKWFIFARVEKSAYEDTNLHFLLSCEWRRFSCNTIYIIFIRNFRSSDLKVGGVLCSCFAIC